MGRRLKCGARFATTITVPAIRSAAAGLIDSGGPMKTPIFGLVCGIALVIGPASATAALPQAATVQASDHTLSERIETRVRQDATLKKRDVKITVDAGVATLAGTVATAAEKTRAAELARVTGVTRVDNRLVV